MKVLLLQEMSGVHTELRKGLRDLGVHADIATLGDGFKNYKSDIYLGDNRNRLLSNFSRVIHQLNLLNKIDEYDIVQTISPNPFNKLIASWMISRVFKNAKSIYIAAGSDPIYRYHVQELDYYPPHDEFKNDLKYANFKNHLKKFDAIIPVCWEYQYAMRQSGFNPLELVPFPISIPKRKSSLRGGKIIVFHPLNRTNLNYDFKGTLLIQEAFRVLRQKYHGVAEFICKGNMNHKEYDTFTDDVDLIVDQVYSYSYGMSAAYGLAKGKVVFSGMEQKIKQGHYTDAPIINLLPDVQHIVESISLFIDDDAKRKEVSNTSRLFAEQYHDTKKVANTYMKIYEKLLE